MAPLVVHLNRGELYDVEPAVSSFEATGPFRVELRNHGQPVHAHLRLDEPLSRVAAVTGQNHYVAPESATDIPVDVAEGAPPVEGVLRVVTGYGNGTATVEVRLVDPETVPADPKPDRGEADATDDDAAGLVDGASLPAFARRPVADTTAAVALGVVAVGAGAVAAAAASRLAVVASIFAVLVATAVAAYLTVR